MKNNKNEIYIPEWPYGSSNVNSNKLTHSSYSRMRGIMARLQNFINNQTANNKKINAD